MSLKLIDNIKELVLNEPVKYQVVEIPVDQLQIDNQKHRTKKEIGSLAESIVQIGQINPVFVKKDGAKYILIAGRRRVTAIQTIQATTGEKQKARCIVLDADQLTEELVMIDENIERENLVSDELDEALYRRKQIYEEMHPETRQHVAGSAAKHGGTSTLSFAADTASKLNIDKRTVEKSIRRASKATPKVKAARAKGDLSPSQVDLVVGLTPEEQDLVLPMIVKKDLKQTKALIARADKVGGKALGMYLTEENDMDDSAVLRRIMRSAESLSEAIDAALKLRLVFRSNAKFQNVKELEKFSETIRKFCDYQRAALGEVRAIRRSGNERKLVRARA